MFLRVQLISLPFFKVDEEFFLKWKCLKYQWGIGRNQTIVVRQRYGRKNDGKTMNGCLHEAHNGEKDGICSHLELENQRFGEK